MGKGRRHAPAQRGISGASMYDQIASNKRRSYLLIFLFILIIVGIGYVFSLYTHLGQWAIVAALVFAIVMS
jgi:hypothetical protein